MLFPVYCKSDAMARIQININNRNVVVRDKYFGLVHFLFSLGGVSRDGPTNFVSRAQRPKRLSVVDEVKFSIITAALIIGRYRTQMEPTGRA